MLTRIGATRPPEDIVDLLLECHARIRTFTELALRLGEAERPDDREVSNAAARVRRYFEEALPLHALDEEESILPRLTGRDPEVDRALAAMQREHAEHGAVLGRVVAVCAELEARPERHRERAGELREATRALRAYFERHLAPEEATIFPAIRRVVPEEERRRMVEELRARRAPHSSR
jgi:iron-sulfur cluster repair protein YtfE (RIC family)